MRSTVGRTLASFVVLCLLVPTGAMADFGTLNYWIGAKPGGGYDRYGRLVATYLERHLPGSTVIPEQRPLGGGIPALRDMTDADPEKGVVMLFNTGVLLSELAGKVTMKPELGAFNWIGKASSEARVLLVHTRTGIESFQQLRDAAPGLVFLTAEYGNSSHVQTKMIDNAFKLGMRVIPGFGGSEAEAALLKGECDGLFISESNVAALVEAGIGRPILVFGEASSQTLKDVERAKTVAQTADEVLTVRLISTMTDLGRITVAPPTMNPERVAQVRRAYAQALADPEFLTEAESQGMPISFMAGEDVERLAREILSGQPRIRELVSEVFKD